MGSLSGQRPLVVAESDAQGFGDVLIQDAGCDCMTNTASRETAVAPRSNSDGSSLMPQPIAQD